MALSVIREATDEDYERVQAAWARFCSRYGDQYYVDLDHIGLIPDEDGRGFPVPCTVKAAWQKAVCRALRLPPGVDLQHPVVIAYGHVGQSGY